jgi:broad specificity phosphatase PhoE
MVRLMLIRHGMTKGNLRSARAAIQVAKGNITWEQMAEYEDKQKEGEGLNEWSGDTRLSNIGEEEAEALGAFWAPMMEHMVREKTLHVYVSPMQRCLQTANPLMTRLKYHGTVYPKIFESPGLCHKSDREFITNTLEPLIMSKKISEALKLYHSHAFNDAGLSENEIRSRFPWITNVLMFPENKDKPWYNESNGYRGWETPETTLQRANDAVNFVKEQAKILPENHTIIFVSHGDYLGELINALLGVHELSHSLNNTSVSSFKVMEDGEVVMEFYNRIPHVKLERKYTLYESMGIKEKKSKSGKKHVDIGEMMRGKRGAGSFSDSPFGELLTVIGSQQQASKL